MQIHLANNSKQKYGGGFTFLRTFEKYLNRAGVQTNEFMAQADVVFISGATMVPRDVIMEAKAQGKKIVLRVDNIPRNSRNRNTGTSRLFDFAQVADLVVYQSNWAKDYIMPFIKKDGPVILNGADTDFFHPDETKKRPSDGEPQYMFAQFNRDETKQFHQAWYQFIQINRLNPQSHLWLVGQFSPELQENKFDFFMGEKFSYFGVVEDPADMAEFYRGADVLLLPYFNDACSNTLIEYLLCNPNGKVIENGTGGNDEILDMNQSTLGVGLGAAGMTEQYIQEIKKIMGGSQVG